MKKILLFALLLAILSGCSGGEEDLNPSSRFAFADSAQYTVDFSIKFPIPPSTLKDPLIEVNKPDYGQLNKTHDVRALTQIYLYYHPKAKQPGEEILVIQSLTQAQDLYAEAFETVNVANKDIQLATIDEKLVYFWKANHVFYEVWISGNQLEDEISNILEQLLTN